MSNNWKGLVPVAILFLVINVLLFFLKLPMQKAGFSLSVLLAANAILFIITIISFFLQVKGLKNTNPNVFVRSVMGAMMIKMLICVGVVFSYVYASGNTYNKRSVFVALFLYLIYLSVEVMAVMKLNKKKDA